MALATRGVRVGDDDSLIDSNGERLSDGDVAVLLRLAGIDVGVDSAGVAQILESVLTQFVRELALLKRDIQLLEWTLGSLNGAVDKTCLSPWRAKRSFAYLNVGSLIKKIEWALSDLTSMARNLDRPYKGSSSDVLRDCLATRKRWRKFLTDK